MKNKNERGAVARARKKILDEAPPAFVRAYEQLREIINDDTRGIIMRRFEMGRIASEMSRDVATYGRQSVDRMARMFSTDPALLSRCKLIFERFGDELEKIVSTPNANGDLLTYSHVSLLSQIVSREARHQFLQACLNNSWTFAELAEEVKSRTEPRSSGGRKYKVPSSLDGFLVNIGSTVEEVAARAQKVWAEPERGFLAQFDQVGAAALSETQVTRLRKVRDELDIAIKALNRLRADFDRVDDAIDRAAEAAEDAAAGAAPPPTPNRTARKRQPAGV